MHSVEQKMLVGSVLLLISILASKTADRAGVPALLLFLGIGMLAGSDGLGHVAFDDANVAQNAGVVAMAFILFAGALQTSTKTLRGIFWKSLSLATLGTVVSTVLVGLVAAYFGLFSWRESLLLGAIVSATDAAAVFTVLRSRHVSLRDPIASIVEVESASNDPMAAFLTVGLISLVITPERPVMQLIPFFFEQMIVGGVIGYLTGRASVFTLKRFRIDHEGLYSVLSLGIVIFTYSVTVVLHGSGFLSVYVAGLVMASDDFLHKKTILRFQDGLAWLMQIGMFLILGLFVYPSHLKSIFWPGLWLSLFLIFVARPLSVWVSLAFSAMSFRDKTMVSWVGLRGAAPIILATFPLVARVPDAERYFNLVFFIVITSVMLQAPSISWVAGFLGATVPLREKRRSPLELNIPEPIDAQLEEFIVPFQAAVVGRRLTELGLPSDSLITLVCREGRYIVPSGQTMLEESDVVSVLATPESLRLVQTVLSRPLASKQPE